MLGISRLSFGIVPGLASELLTPMGVFVQNDTCLKSAIPLRGRVCPSVHAHAPRLSIWGCSEVGAKIASQKSSRIETASQAGESRTV